MKSFRSLQLLLCVASKLYHIYLRGPNCSEGLLHRANIFFLGTTPRKVILISLRAKIWLKGLMKSV